MTNSTATNAPDLGFSPWQRLKSKRISYLVLPLLVMATVTEFVILATGWKYQQMACLPQGMGVTFFGIGPIGATILAVELLKLPLAIWTASRMGWQKGFMLVVGLPLICVLTFQLVKDMAVYEMGVAMTPANQMFEKATAEEVKISKLNGELAVIEQKKTDRERKLAELSAKKAKAKADFEESLKRNADVRQDAISLTDYQKKELSEVESRQAAIIKQFDADTAQLTKATTDLRAQREIELGRATKWNAEEARIENAYKAKLAEYANKKAAYEKDKTDYDNANFLKRQLLKEPVSPGVPPEREANTVLKPTAIAEMDAQIKAKEAELLAVNNKRRDRIAQVDADARQVRGDFDRRSSTKREDADRKREDLSAGQVALAAELKAEEKQADVELAGAVQKVDGIRAALDVSRKKAEGYYEAREASIRNTQVHRIATTVEIVRGLLMGERPMSIKASAKERGDLLTDQISMVRIWVYPVLAFIVAFLPTLMVEIGFSTLFEPEQVRPPHRLGFFGRRLHWLYTRAGRQKILRAERSANEATAQIAARDKALAATKTASERALAEKEVELQAALEASDANAAEREAQFKQQEVEWVANLSSMADSLNRTVIEKDALRDLQKSEVERQISMRQNAWSERVTQLRQELDDQRAAGESERTALLQEHQKKLLEVTEDCKTQVIQARRQMADAELGAVDKTAKLSHELKEALRARDEAESKSRHQADALALRLSQAEEDAAREKEKTARQEKHRLERQQLEFEKTLRQREDDFDRRLKQREQELALEADARVVEDKSRAEQESRIREAELERQLEARAREIDAQWSREVEQKEDAAQIKLKQREQQLQSQAEARLRAVQTQAEEQLRRRESEFERLLDTQARETESRLREELQAKEQAFHAKLKEREQELTGKAATWETELKDQWASDLRAREEDWKQQAESRVRAAEARLAQEAQQKEEVFQSKIRQRELQLQSQLDARQAELQAQRDQDLRRRAAESAEAGQREQDLIAKLNSLAEAHQVARKEWETGLESTRGNLESLKAQLVRTEKERDEAREFANDGFRQVQSLEKKLTEASAFLIGLQNGKHLVGGRS
ncbi:MAG: hypothetical protein EXS35_04975 [Pedosphaera sp.]|nr:hypothetical protein [Pedosphaera sp.]